jgi:hypothetical protein
MRHTRHKLTHTKMADNTQHARRAQNTRSRRLHMAGFFDPRPTVLIVSAVPRVLTGAKIKKKKPTLLSITPTVGFFGYSAQRVDDLQVDVRACASPCHGTWHMAHGTWHTTRGLEARSTASRRSTAIIRLHLHLYLHLYLSNVFISGTQRRPRSITRRRTGTACTC